MKHCIKSLLCLSILALLVAACQSTKQVASSTKAEEAQSAAIAKLNMENRFMPECFSSKIHIEITGQGDKITANGTLKIKQGQLMQLSITPLLGIEIARIEITPDTLLVIDRFNKQYVQVPLKGLGLSGNTEAAYTTLESLFLNNLFLPGKDKRVSLTDIRQLFLQKEGEGITATPKKKREGETSYTFHITPKGELTATCIHAPQKYDLTWEYSDFLSTANGRCPTNMQVTLQSNAIKAQAQISYSRISTKGFDIKQSSISKKYKQLDINGLLKIIPGL